MFDWVFHFYNVRWRTLVVGTLNDVPFTSTTELPDFYLKGDQS
jgi:hypothetical protein